MARMENGRPLAYPCRISDCDSAGLISGMSGNEPRITLMARMGMAPVYPCNPCDPWFDFQDAGTLPSCGCGSAALGNQWFTFWSQLRRAGHTATCKNS